MNREKTTLSYPWSMGKQLRAIAQAEGIPVEEVVRQGIENHIAAKTRERDFKERLAKRMEEDREVLEALGDD
jgi:hypothetical protein